jgi:hypothetical protein
MFANNTAWFAPNANAEMKTLWTKNGGAITPSSSALNINFFFSDDPYEAETKRSTPLSLWDNRLLSCILSLFLFFFLSL